MLNVTLDLEQFHRKVAQSKQALERDMEKAVRRATTEGRDVARAGGWKDRTGELRRTLQITAFSWSGAKFWGEYRTQVPYALFVEEPTKPHAIVAKNAKALRWYEGSQPVFARSVWHPGTTGFRFMEVSSKEARKELLQELSHGFVNLKSVWGEQ